MHACSNHCRNGAIDTGIRHHSGEALGRRHQRPLQNARTPILSDDAPQKGPGIGMKLGGDARDGQSAARKNSMLTLLSLLRRAARQSGREGFFIELFSGAGPVSGQLRSMGYTCLAIDLDSTGIDLTQPSVIALLCRWIELPCVLGVFIAFPCSTWSRARTDPIRFAWCIDGRPDLSGIDLRRARFGNLTLRATRCFIRACLRSQTPCLAENPVNSMAWMQPGLKRLINHRFCHLHTLDQCQYGTSWRKRTRIASWFAPPPANPHHLCPSRRGICTTGRPHKILRGGNLTSLAQKYPKDLSVFLAKWLCNSAAFSAISVLQRIGSR